MLDIAVAHDGRATAASNADAGSTFTIEFPAPVVPRENHRR